MADVKIPRQSRQTPVPAPVWVTGNLDAPLTNGRLRRSCWSHPIPTRTFAGVSGTWSACPRGPSCFLPVSGHILWLPGPREGGVGMQIPAPTREESRDV